MMTSNQPTMFELSGHDVEIHYSTSSIAGQPLLSGKVEGKELSAKGDEIRAVPTPLGTLIQVTLLASDRAGRSHELAFFVPPFRTGGDGTYKFTTAGLLTTNHDGEVGGKDPKSLIDYKSVSLHGTASTAVF